MHSVLRRALIGLTSVTLLTLGAAVPAHAATCSPTGFVRDGINLTAAQIGGDVTGALDASGCDIGVYYNAANPPTSVGVSGATITGATYFGVVVDGGVGSVSVSVTDSTISDMGDSPFSGAQHGVGVYYDGYNTPGTVTGSVSGNTVSSYQKGGIVVNGANATVQVTGNTVAGLGPVDFIAQNGIQFGFGASGSAVGNDISGNFYTGTVGIGPNLGGQSPPGWQYVSAGLLLYQPGTVWHASNHYAGNQHNVAMYP